MSPLSSISDQSLDKLSVPKLDIRDQVQQIDDLPAIPEMAIRILELRDDPDATVEQLVEVIQMDPAMTAQVIRYANSPLYTRSGQVDSLQDAIFRVLGYDTVLYLALGSALAQAFTLPANGPLGLKAFWGNAVFSAALVQKLTTQHASDWGIKPGTAYLCALLHNIGTLVLAMLFESEFFWLNKVLQAKPDYPTTLVENQLLGCSHTELGRILMTSWHMPEVIAIASGEHHNLAYEGEYAPVVNLIQVTDQLLRSHQMSDADSDEVSSELCEKLGLAEDELYLAMDDVLESSEVLEAMANSFSKT